MNLKHFHLFFQKNRSIVNKFVDADSEVHLEEGDVIDPAPERVPSRLSRQQQQQTDGRRTDRQERQKGGPHREVVRPLAQQDSNFQRWNSEVD